MVGFVLRRFSARAAICTAAVMALLCSSPRLATADIIYKLLDYPAEQIDHEGDPWSISGTIVTYDMTGFLSGSDIKSWYWTATNLTTLEEVHADSSVGLPEPDYFSADGLSLTIPDDGGSLKLANETASGELIYLSWKNPGAEVTYEAQLLSAETTDWSTTPASEIIAIRAPGSGSVVPEPSSILIWSGLVSVGAFFGQRANRRSGFPA